jgi:hypothetical protein
MPLNVARVVRFRQRDRSLSRATWQIWYAASTRDGAGVVILSNPAFQHRHGTREEHIAIASRYSDLVGDKALRDAIFRRVRLEWEATICTLLEITDQKSLLESNPSLARSIRNRFPYLDPLNHLQIELLKRHREGETQDRIVEGIHLTINGIAAGLRNSG